MARTTSQRHSVGPKDGRASVMSAARTLALGTAKQDHVFVSNAVKTSIYTVLNFPAKNLFKQFTRFSNIYFLFITALQLIPQVTSSQGLPTMIVPLVFIIVVSGVRDAIEDFDRHQADNQQNYAPVYKLQLEEPLRQNPKSCGMTFQHESRCQDLKVGELVRVKQNDEIPADVLVLATSNDHGQCFVMTANLDGESSLKSRYAPPGFWKPMYQQCFTKDGHLEPAAFATLNGAVVTCEPPNRRIDRFKGSLVLGKDEVLDLDISHLLLRGTQLRDTKWAVGVVIYTGDDTRVRQNSSNTSIKKSWLYQFINRVTVWVVVAQVVILLVAVWLEKQMVGADAVQKNPYIADETKYATTVDYMWVFLAYMLLFSNFVPISLQVTVDFTRYFQAHVIERDSKFASFRSTASVAAAPAGTMPKMAKVKGDKAVPSVRRRVRVQSSDLNEELFLVEHIFSDNKGKMTCNRMEFRSCHIDGKSYNLDDKSGQLVLAAEHGSRTASTTNSRPTITPEKTMQVQNFLLSLAVNNSIAPTQSDSKEGPSIEYAGPSPDERALVIAAAQSGIVLKKRDHAQVTITISNVECVLPVLHVFEFTSERKRSSVVCQESNGNVRVFCKGADSFILSALHERNNPGKIHQAQEQMKVYCSNGLRVLCIAERLLTAEEYNTWNDKYVSVRSNHKAAEEDLELVIAELEQQLTLLGVTGIEDKIQTGAPEALEKFRQAGIKVWMLTGDRPDTATNVAYAVRLISSDMKLIQLCGNDWLDSRTDAVEFMQRELQMAQEHTVKHRRMAMLVNDLTIEAIKAFRIERQFLELCLHCESVLCALISPKQKEFIVEMVRRQFPDKITLAVGDGANDVPMIQRAHIGVGIAGEEGHQAANASDYSLPSFQYLQRLILVHGRGMNRRIATLTLYVFYKNVLLVFPQFIYGAYCLYSGHPPLVLESNAMRCTILSFSALELNTDTPIEISRSICCKIGNGMDRYDRSTPSSSTVSVG
jgi:magnesium-transporting ATPase (P-type)